MVSTTTLTTGTGALEGATAGASIGSVGGPIGSAIGGVVGGVLGGLGGLFGGKKAKKARKYAKMASNIQSQREANMVADQYRQMLRTARVARAGSMAASISSGIETSSLSTSALSSIGSQAQYNVQFLAEDRRLYSIYKQYMEKAGQAANAYQNTMASLSLIGGVGRVYGKNIGNAAVAVGGLVGTGYDALKSYVGLGNPSSASDINTAGVQALNQDLKSTVKIEDLA